MENNLYQQDDNKKVIEFVTLILGNQKFGIIVDKVRDVLAPKDLAKIPLTPPEIAGSLNLRGRIVTALDTRVILGLGKSADYTKSMNLVIEYNQDNSYSLLVDEVQEVFTIEVSKLLPNPENMSSIWKEFSLGIYSQNEELIVILDTTKMINHLLNRGTL